MRKIVALKDEFYNRYIIKGNLFAPVVELGPLRMWKAIIGESSKPQELFWRLKESVDTYFSGHVFGVTVVAGLLRVHVPKQGAAAQAAADTAGAYWRRFPELDAIWQSAGCAGSGRSAAATA